MKPIENEPTLSHTADPAMNSDSVLLDAARTMDHDALIQIFDRYAVLLYRYALRLCWDPVIADQIVGDAFAKLLEQLSAGLGPRSNLRSYLYQMTYHLVVDEMRYAKRRTPLEMLENVRSDDATFSTLEERILFDNVMNAVRTHLTSDQQHVIVLRFVEGMSLQETALIMGKQVNHIKVIQTRAIQRLRKSLQESEKDDVKADVVGRGFGTLGFDFAG